MKTYIVHIAPYHVALLGVIFIVLTFAFQLAIVKRANRAANRFLAMALAVVALWLLWVLGRDIGLEAYFPHWNLLPLRFSLALGPLIYFYVRRITRPEEPFRLRDLTHFAPLLLEQGAFVAICHTLAFISVGTYLYLSHRLIERFYRSRKFSGGDRYRYELRWLQRLLMGFGLSWLLWIPFVAADYFYYDHQPGGHVYYPLYLLLGVMAIRMAVVAFLRTEVGLPADAPSFLKPPPPLELKHKSMWLKKAVKTNRYYQDPALSLNSLAEKLELTPHELSRIVNTVLKKSFNDFINEYRIADVIRKMQDPAYDHLTLLGIAYESGFNSKTTFNRTFKQLTGKSPVAYRNDLKKEVSSYNLGRHHRFAPVISGNETTSGWLQEKSNGSFMFKNYFKIARRNLMRNKGYAAINILGLAVGIAVCLMIFIIIQFHRSFDEFHEKKDRIYRVLTEHHADAADIAYDKGVPFPLPNGLKTAFPQLEEIAPVYASHDDQLQVLEANGTPVKNFKEQTGVFYTTPSFFSIFDFPLLAGSYASLKDPNNVLLTRESAEKYFGDWKTAVGKTLKLTGSYRIGAGLFQSPPITLKVSGILADIPGNTDFQLKLVVAFGTDFTGDKKYGLQIPDWKATAPEFGCYLLLPPDISAADFNRQLREYTRKVQAPDHQDSYVLQALSEVHYDTQTGNYSSMTISRELIGVLWLIASFILLTACVNFVNLSTAQAVNRAREVGVRKVLGSNKSQLQVQFIVETFLIVTCAVLLATAMVIPSLSSVSQLLELSLPFSILGSPAVILFLLTVTLAVTACAGFYPSVVLSRFNPVHALKSKFTVSTAKGISLRRAMVVFQFAVAQVLIIGTLVIVKQMNYFMNQPLGFDKEAVVNIPFRPDSTGTKLSDYLRQQLLSVNGVQGVSFSSSSPLENDHNLWTALKFDHAIKEEDFQAIAKFVDDSYVPTYKLQLVAGRNLQPSGMTREFLVNESLVKSLGLKNPEEILGKEISMFGDVIKCPVVGVLKDFNDRPFHHRLAPLLMTTNSTMYRQAGIKLETSDISSTMQAIKALWEQTFPDHVFEYRFLDEKIEGFYKQENQLATLYKIFAGIAIFLSCLGLYGLASFMAVQRIKEVGIRKVLGASTGNIVYLFSKEFIMLIAVAFVIAAPIAWYYMHQWLQDYAYRIDISWWPFAAGGFAAIIIALITISFQAIKAALANPVKSLRSE